MEEGGYRHLPVIGETGKPVGVLSVKRVVHYLVEHFPATIYNLRPCPMSSPATRRHKGQRPTGQRGAGFQPAGRIWPVKTGPTTRFQPA